MSYSITVLVSIALVIACVYSGIGVFSESGNQMTMDEINKRAQEQTAELYRSLGLNVPIGFDPDYVPEESQPTGTFDIAYSKATDEQRKALLEARENDPYERYGAVPERRIMQIMGELSGEAPRLTVADAKKVISEYVIKTDDFVRLEPEKVISAFNEIAGAPDSVIIASTSYYHYFLDDTIDECVTVNTFGEVRLEKALDRDYIVSLFRPYFLNETPEHSASPVPNSPYPYNSASEGSEISPTPMPPVK